MTPEELKAARTKLGFSQEDLAEALGCNRRHLQKMEKGERGVTPERARAVELLLRGAAVPDDLRGSAQLSRRPPPDWEGDAEEFETIPMTRGTKIGLAVFAAAAVGGFVWLSRAGEKFGAALAEVLASLPK